MYFDKVLSIGSLATHLGMDLSTLRGYRKRDDYGELIIWARNIIENYLDETTINGKNTAGVIFNLTNNFGKHWKDTRSASNTLNVNVGTEKTIEQRESNMQQLQAAVEPEIVQTIEKTDD